ncbi:MAG: ammonium transporter [Eubacteriaceae bacterium]
MLNSGDMAFIMTCVMLVFFMTPGLALFYGGMVRRKNVINTLISVVFCCGLATILWFLFGFSVAFAPDAGDLGFIGDFSHALFKGINATEAGDYAQGIPGAMFAIFQLMFCIITPAILVGALSGRMRFKAMFIFVATWLTLVYFPLAHMVWGESGLNLNLGAVDFAGGNVIHTSSGVSGLVAFGCHGISGIWDGIATDLFAQTAINPLAQWDGLFFGDTKLLTAQLLAIIITIVYAVVVTSVIMFVLKKTIEIRVDTESEDVGLDIGEHSEQAYAAFSGIDQ